MKFRELYGKTFGNWDPVYSGSVVDIPPAIASWTALATVITCLAITGDETLNNGQIIDSIAGDSVVAPRLERPSPKALHDMPVHIGKAALDHSG